MIHPEERLAVLEAEAEIRRLKARYCRACDDGHDAAAVLELFAPDGVWEVEGREPRRGRAAIRAAFEDLSGSVEFSQHRAAELELDVAPEGLTATGRWHFTGVLCFRGRPPILGVALYEEAYARHEGRWLITHLHATRLSTMYLGERRLPRGLGSPGESEPPVGIEPTT